MSRFPRPVIADVPIHIIQRGNNRQACFFSGTDYRTYLEMLADATQRFPCAVHAYALMPNHVHLLATPQQATAPAAMLKWLSQRYVQHINRKYRRDGTLWQGRYRSCLVENERYFMVCQRYIELNPVRAAMVKHPAEYDWSSYRANAFGQRSLIITAHRLYAALGDEANVRQARYRKLVDECLTDEQLAQVRAATNSNLFLGSPDFVDQMAYALGRNTTRQRPGRRRD